MPDAELLFAGSGVDVTCDTPIWGLLLVLLLTLRILSQGGFESSVMK